MTTAERLLREATRRGILLRAADGRIGVKPADRLDPAFAEQLRRHKSEILALLEAMEHGLPDDCAAWIHIGRQVLEGEFAGADSSLTASLKIGLKSVPHDTCRAALLKLTE